MEKVFHRLVRLLTWEWNFDIIKKSGSWFSYGETKLGQGRDGVKQILNDNPELYDELKAKVTEALKK